MYALIVELWWLNSGLSRRYRFLTIRRKQYRVFCVTYMRLTPLPRASQTDSRRSLRSQTSCPLEAQPNLTACDSCPLTYTGYFRELLKDTRKSSHDQIYKLERIEDLESSPNGGGQNMPKGRAELGSLLGF